LTIDSSFPISRRQILLAGAGLFAPAFLPIRVARSAALSEHRLVAAPGEAALAGEGRSKAGIFAYDGTIPGRLFRLRQGEPVRIAVENRLDQDTTVHWHGIRLVNAMDGVPGLTQPPINPGETFTYEFTPPDAGTFWYHPHAHSLQQLGRGLAGPLIVEEREPVVADRDILWVLQDWRLTADSQISPDFGSMMDAAMAGRVGNAVTINGSKPGDLSVHAGERIRLRLANAALARILAPRFEGHRPIVIAVDGQPCEPHEPEGGRLVLGPAMRIDVLLDAEGEPGHSYAVIDDFYDGLAYTLISLVYENAPKRPSPPRTALTLPANPLPEPDLAKAVKQEIVLQGGMMGGGKLAGVGGMNGMAMPGMMGGPIWAINGMSMTGDGQMNMPPLFTLQRGQSCRITMRNETAWWHTMHIHGFSMLVLARNGVPVPYRQWQDSVLMAPKDVVECAFVADNPGNWMLHCHVTDHQMTGLMTVFRVT
jgi:FtsP/CotA-like multicopper oxidase with cupredoxin domain